MIDVSIRGLHPLRNRPASRKQRFDLVTLVHMKKYRVPALALLRNSRLRPDSAFPRCAQATRTISAVPSALKRLMSATRIWISAVWRSGSLVDAFAKGLEAALLNPDPAPGGERAFAAPLHLSGLDNLCCS
ncbi:MAG: hypothetical protein ACJA1E_001830 [Paracoccaceae bacterium]